ncbi:MAG: ATP-binding protein, partial [Chloroflexota bacterium]
MTEAFGNLATDQAGYRLHRLEVYNWGTFDGSVYSVAPAGNTALLTGKNGSGKSTLVDALLTLLVPTRGTGGRNYNQAAGNQARERTEVSYVRGAYGQLHNDERGTTETRYLRTEKTYSVLLATFENPVLERTVTAGMVFWFSNGSLTKFYVLAQRPLSVSEHFRAESDIGRTLKKDLRDMDGVKVFDQFNRYSAALNRRLGLGEKAVDLFNQIVAIKDISGLNDFVRRHMLNEYDSRAAIDDLRQQYNDLTTAFNAIERAEQQRDQLQPLLNDVQRHTDQQERIAETTYKIDALPLYKATIQRRYLKSRITKLQAKQSELETERTALEQRITQLDAKRTDIQSTLASNDINRRLQDLQAQAKRHEDTLRDRQKTAQKYQQAVRAAELDDTLSADAFAQNQQQAAKQLRRIDDEKQRLNDERIALGVQLEKLKEQGQEVEAEIESLCGRKSQLDRTSLNIRAGLAQVLDLPEDTFPYVGELLRVKEDEAQWEPAIQRVLNGLGRQLLVPNVYYDPVSEYVEQNDLKGRLVYQRVKGAPSVSESHLPDNALYFKL